MQYQPGQRWISDSEAELGLGTILAEDGRLLTVLYPATGDTRQYSLRNAPLTRVRFAPGDEITHFEGWKLNVQEVEDVDGLLVYHGITAQNEPRTLPETQLNNFIQFRLANDRLFAGQMDPHKWFALRYHTLEHRSRLLQSSLWGLSGARAQPIAHQLHIAREVADRVAPRVLLADEVGLGKPIEAGLVIHRQIISGRANRVRSELAKKPAKGEKSWIKSGIASTALGPIGWLYAGSLREAVPAATAWLAVMAIASKFIPMVLLMPVLMVALPLSGLAGVLYAIQYNRAGGKRTRLFGDKDKKQLASGD